VIQTVNCWNRFDHQTAYQYLFYPFEKYVHNNVLLSSIFGFAPITEGQNIRFVSSTHNFAHVITFMVDPGLITSPAAASVHRLLRKPMSLTAWQAS
jgi:hypothetical protein